MRYLLLLCLVLIVDASCGASRSLSVPLTASECTIVADEYDQTCTTAADCTVVFEGDVCSEPCACPGAAINRDSLVQYQADIAKIVHEEQKDDVCHCPEIRPPTCVNGRCLDGAVAPGSARSGRSLDGLCPAR